MSTPIFQASAFRSGDPYFYTRNSNPNFEEVETLFCALDGAAGSVLYSAGMASISAVLSLLRPGEVLVVNRLIYGCSYRFIQDQCAHLGIDLHVVDLGDPGQLRSALDAHPRMIVLETPTNPFLKTLDIRAIASAFKARCPDALLVVDNTWATPLLQRPLEHGADIVVYSASKFFSGHSDLILGIACAASPTIVEQLRKFRFYAGAVPDPFAAWLLRRSLQTLELRLQRHIDNTRQIVRFLSSHAMVAEVMQPTVDGVQLRDYGGMIFLTLKDPGESAVGSFVAALQLFDRGTSLACVTSAVAIPYSGSHLSMTPEEKATIGLTPSLLRLSVGIESAADLIADLAQALEAVKARPGAGTP